MAKIAIHLPKYRKSLCAYCIKKCINPYAVAAIVSQNDIFACEEFEPQFKDNEYIKFIYAEKIK